MAFIYKIINDINNKIYVGKTHGSIEKRFQEHCRAINSRKTEKRPLYSAMNKYGIEHFHIELVEETNEPEEQEQYWIKYYDSYHNGYNATLGGDGRPYIDYDKVVELYKILQNQNEVAKKLNIDKKTVNSILKDRKINRLSSPIVNKQKLSKQIGQFNLEDKLIQTFDSAIEAARALGKITSTSNGASSHITDVCRGKRKTAYGYKWKFI